MNTDPWVAIAAEKLSLSGTVLPVQTDSSRSIVWRMLPKPYLRCIANRYPLIVPDVLVDESKAHHSQRPAENCCHLCLDGEALKQSNEGED